MLERALADLDRQLAGAPDPDGAAVAFAPLAEDSPLAALTPAFASREMLQGDTPEPADDICVPEALLQDGGDFDQGPVAHLRDFGKIPPPPHLGGDQQRHHPDALRPHAGVGPGHHGAHHRAPKFSSAHDQHIGDANAAPGVRIAERRSDPNIQVLP